MTLYVVKLRNAPMWSYANEPAGKDDNVGKITCKDGNKNKSYQPSKGYNSENGNIP